MCRRHLAYAESQINMNKRTPYHAHVYFTEESKATAQNVVMQASELFGVDYGHFHDKPVGPHPVGSCQITVPVNLLGPMLDWLALNRQGLTVFIHAETGDVMKDHTEHTIWMGSMPGLNIEMLESLLAQRDS